jgi:TonB family protein
MAYALAISLLLAGAARAAEFGLRLYGRPVRAVWAAAIGLSLALPLAGYVIPLARPLSPQPLGLAPVVDIALGVAASPGTGPGAAGALPPWLDGALALAWVLASVVLLAFYAASYGRLRGASRGWPAASLGGTKVLVSDGAGPGVMGFLRGRILLPGWALKLEDEVRRMIVMHEEEHLRAGDQRLVYGALLAAVLVPWNLPLWWQGRRLRLAVELDCDRRVLGRGVPPGLYGRLLLEVGRRRSAAGDYPAAFIEPRSLLEERVRAMTSKATRGRRGKAIAAAGLAGLLLALACAAPRPSDEVAAPAGEAPSAQGAGQETARLTGTVVDALSGAPVAGAKVELEGAGRGAITALNGRYFLVDVEPGVYVLAVEMDGYQPFRADDVELRAGETQALDVALTSVSAAERVAPGAPAPLPGEGPTFTPYTERPRIKDQREAVAIVERYYPEHLRQKGVGGTAMVWIFIDESGKVKDARIQKSSGYVELDLAAVGAARELEFLPARNRDRVVPVWVAVPFVFSVRKDTPPAARSDTASSARRGTAPASVGDRPQFTPFTEPPRLKDRERAMEIMTRLYPEPLKAQGVTGTAVVWMFVDEAGTVRKTVLEESSGYDALDRAALAAAQQFEFTPARLHDRIVPVWVAMPIAFNARR